MKSVALVLVASSLVSAAPSTPTGSEFAAPEIIVFHGPELSTRVYLPEWKENHRLLLAASESPAGVSVDLTHRRSIAVALFWGQQWRPHARQTASLGNLDPARASQHAAYYPAQSGTEALLVFRDPRVSPRIRRIGPEGVKILTQRGVPITIDE